nr:hypothetical protein CFP56_22435 [Quercus suber]
MLTCWVMVKSQWLTVSWKVGVLFWIDLAWHCGLLVFEEEVMHAGRCFGILSPDPVHHAETPVVPLGRGAESSPSKLYRLSRVIVATILTVTLQDLPNDLCCFSVRVEQFPALLPFLRDSIVFVQQLLEQAFFVQLTDKTVLHNVFAVIDKQMHDGFWDLIGYGLTHDIEIVADKASDEFGFEGLAFGKSWT